MVWLTWQVRDDIDGVARARKRRRRLTRAEKDRGRDPLNAGGRPLGLSNTARGLVALGVCALSASLLVAVQQEADAAHACRVPTTARLDKTEKFAGHGTSRYYYATAQGSAVGGYDHTGNVIMTKYGQG